jgi:hypothetical protein
MVGREAVSLGGQGWHSWLTLVGNDIDGRIGVFSVSVCQGNPLGIVRVIGAKALRVDGPLAAAAEIATASIK